ncbi:MAG: hypothetical protein ACE5JZ_03025 [Kiloniellales bacterium]
MLAAFFLPGSADAQCTTPADVTLRVLAQVPDAEAVQHQGEMSERLGALFNATPPITDDPIDQAVVYSSDRLARVLVVLFFHGCRVGAVYLPRDAYLALVRDATGVAL